MRKSNYLFLLILISISLTAFISCSNADNNDDNTPQQSLKQSVFTYYYKTNSDLLNMADVTVYYIGTDGVEHQEPLTTTSWTKTFVADNFGVTTGFAVGLVPKANIDSTKDKYEIYSDMGYKVESHVNGYVLDFSADSTIQISTTSWPELHELLRSSNDSYATKVDATGKVGKTTVKWTNYVGN